MKWLRPIKEEETFRSSTKSEDKKKYYLHIKHCFPGRACKCVVLTTTGHHAFIDFNQCSDNFISDINKTIRRRVCVYIYIYLL